MSRLSDLERAVLDVIAAQAGEHADALRAQIASAKVVFRRNTGAGFYTTLAVGGLPMQGASRPLGDVHATVEGLEREMGFQLWLEDGLARELEGYTYGESTVGMDLNRAGFTNVGPAERVHVTAAEPGP